MNAKQKIQHITNRLVVEVREWAFVYWVKFDSGRPTLYSKKMVDRAEHIQVIRVQSSDAIVRDTLTGKAYATRANWQLGHSIKELPKGTAIDLSNFDYAMLPGESIHVGHVRKPARVSHLISMVVFAS